MKKADPTNPLKNKIIKSNVPHREENYLTTAVYKAIMLDRLDILYLFYHYGVDFNKICNEVRYTGGTFDIIQTPIQVAVANKNYEIASFLILIGVEI